MNYLTKLEDANIRSEDLYSGDAVNGYLSGDISRSDLRTELSRRRREMERAIKGIDKLLSILPNCPEKVNL